MKSRGLSTLFPEYKAFSDAVTHSFKKAFASLCLKWRNKVSQSMYSQSFDCLSTSEKKAVDAHIRQTKLMASESLGGAKDGSYRQLVSIKHAFKGNHVDVQNQVRVLGFLPAALKSTLQMAAKVKSQSSVLEFASKQSVWEALALLKKDVNIFIGLKSRWAQGINHPMMTLQAPRHIVNLRKALDAIPMEKQNAIMRHAHTMLARTENITSLLTTATSCEVASLYAAKTSVALLNGKTWIRNLHY